MIMGADELAATVGTLTHWSMFCKPGAKFIMLNRTDYSSLALQCLINQAFKVDYYIVDASKNFMYANWNVGVCMLGSNRHWKNFVANYFGERIDVDDDAPSFDGELGRYVDFWCRKYPQSKHAQRWIDSLKAMCDRIVALEKQIYAKRPLIRYQTHVGQDGWKAWRRENFVPSIASWTCRQFESIFRSRFMTCTIRFGTTKRRAGRRKFPTARWQARRGDRNRFSGSAFGLTTRAPRGTTFFIDCMTSAANGVRGRRTASGFGRRLPKSTPFRSNWRSARKKFSVAMPINFFYNRLDGYLF